jgi:HlyD family secretion protein
MKKRTWIITGLVAVLIAGGVFASTRATTSDTSSALANATTAPVTRTTLFTSVDSNGSIIPQSTVDLSFGSSGTVEQVNVDMGDEVQQGDVLATLDATSLQLAVTHAEQAYIRQQLAYSETVEADPTDVAVAEAAYNSAVASYNAARQDYSNLSIKESVQCSSLSSAKTNLDRAQAEYDRLANDHQAKNYLSSDWGPYQNVVNGLTNAQSAYDLALANCNITKTSLNDSSLRSAQSQVQSAKAKLDTLVSPRAEEQILARTALEKTRLALEQAKRNLTDAQIVAPFDGVITAVDITVGDTGGASTAMTIADVSQLHVDVLVDETEIANVQAGQTAQLTLDALTGITLTGKVAYIAPSGLVSNGVVNYSVRVNLDPTEAPLLLDMSADASLVGEKHENVLAVPTKAIHTATASNGQTPPVSRTGQLSNTVQSGRPITNTQDGQGGPQRMTGSFVMVLENGQPHPVQVTVGMTAGDLTEVSGDLKEGDQVLVTTTTTSATSRADQPGDFGPPAGAPDGGMGGPPPGAGGPPPGG